MSPVRVFVAALGVEVNTFSPLPTNRASLEALWWHPAGSLRRGQEAPLVAPQLARLWELEEAGQVIITQGLCAGAQPAGPIARRDYEEVRHILLNDLAEAGEVDVVLLGLHGATVAHGYDDVEGDLLSAIRDIVGPKVVIGGLLDPHCHLTARMLGASDLLIAYKQYPHTDIFPAAARLTDLAVATARGEITPVMRAYNCRQISIVHTTREPALSVIGDMASAEAADPLILDISIAQGFPWGDVPDMGMRVWTVTDDRPGLAAAVSERFGQRLVGLRGRMRSPMMTAEEAIRQLLVLPAGPVVIADSADNPGGGAPSDGTQLLRGILEAGVENIAVGLIWDPVAVSFCVAAGEGATLSLRIGGKACRFSGDPLDLEVEVTRIVEDLSIPFGGGVWPVGLAVAVRAGGLEIVLTGERVQCLHQAAFTALGIDLTRKRAVIVKSAHHFYTSFVELTDRILYVDQHGVLTDDYRSLTYRNVERPIWPLDDVAEAGPFPFQSGLRMRSRLRKSFS